MGHSLFVKNDLLTWKHCEFIGRAQRIHRERERGLSKHSSFLESGFELNNYLAYTNYD